MLNGSNHIPAFNEVTGVILAGGQSRRYGCNKALVEVQGVRLIERIVALMKALFKNVILITNSPHEYDFLDLAMYPDCIKGLGPLGGIYTGLKSMPDEAGFFAACDMPFLNPDLIQYVVELRQGFDVVVPRLEKGFLEPLHAVYHKTCLPALENLIHSKNNQIFRFFPLVRVRYFELDEIRRIDPELLSFININRPDEWPNFFNKVKKIMEAEILKLIKAQGPLTGQALWDRIGGDKLNLWRTCRISTRLAVRRVGTRYLRFDRRLENSVRLSPSILREFLTYSLVGLSEEQDLLEKKSHDLALQFAAISRSKSQLIYNVVSALIADLAFDNRFLDQVCFILAGDIVFQMAHNVPRPERSTGKLVKGSDIDLVVIVTDDFPPEWTQRLDAAIFEQKQRLLLAPHVMEEIDYVIKNLEKVREQSCFGTFKQRVACKIMQEGTLLYGSERLFQMVKEILKQQGLVQKLNQMQYQAEILRKEAETRLLTADPDTINTLYPGLFYPADESEEFE